MRCGYVRTPGGVGLDLAWCTSWLLLRKAGASRRQSNCQRETQPPERSVKLCQRKESNKAMKSQIETTIPVTDAPTLEVSDIQATVLRPRPRPYKGEYVVLRIDDAAQGREMLRRLLPHVAPADKWWEPTLPGW